MSHVISRVRKISVLSCLAYETCLCVRQIRVLSHIARSIYNHPYQLGPAIAEKGLEAGSRPTWSLHLRKKFSMNQGQPELWGRPSKEAFYCDSFEERRVRVIILHNSATVKTRGDEQKRRLQGREESIPSAQKKKGTFLFQSTLEISLFHMLEIIQEHIRRAIV